MEQLACFFGVVEVGDVVEFQHPTGDKIGKIKAMHDTLNAILVDIYYTDRSGGYTLTVPHYALIGFSKTKPVEQAVESTSEEIKKPKRYNKRGKLECWDVILDQEMNFLEGSVLKYLWRYKEKNGIHDLEKAKIYIDKIIEGLKNEKSN